MTPILFQKALVKEVEKIFAGKKFKNPLGQDVELNVFRQQLPIPEDEDTPDPFPYILVRMESGETESQTTSNSIEVSLIYAYFDDNTDNGGTDGVLDMIQHVYERFEKDNLLDNQYVFKEPFKWALQDEQSFPYFFGASAMTFETPAIRRESKFI